MHPVAKAPASPKKAKGDSTKHAKEQLLAWADSSARDSQFFTSLDSTSQICVLDFMVKGSVSKLRVDQRKAFLSCCLIYLKSTNSFTAAPDKVMHVVRSWVDNEFLSIAELRAVVFALRRCLERVISNRHAITALHAVFVQLCVSLDMFDVAFPLVSTPIYDIDSVLIPTPLEYLSFHYFSSLVFAAFKRFDKSLASLDLAIGAVSAQISAIQIAVYKKRVLIDIILNGSESTPLPKLISPIVLKNIETFSAPYQQFAEAASDGHQVLEGLFEQHQDQLKQDGNIGLARQALEALRKVQIAKLAGSYMTLSLNDVAHSIGIQNLAAVEAMVLSIVEEGSINATIDQSRQILTFYEDSIYSSKQESLPRLLEQLQEISVAHDRILAKNIAMATDMKFLKKSVNGNLKLDSTGMFPNAEPVMNITEMQQLFG